MIMIMIILWLFSLSFHFISFHLPYRCSLLGNWSSASKYEQMVLEVLMAAEKKDEKAIEESEKKVKEYNTKVMMKMSMRSILGWAVCLSVLSLVLCYQLSPTPYLSKQTPMTSCQFHCFDVSSTSLCNSLPRGINSFLFCKFHRSRSDKRKKCQPTTRISWIDR